jgi:hypothetical protein
MWLMGKYIDIIFYGLLCCLAGCSHRGDLPSTNILFYIEDDSNSSGFSKTARLPISGLEIPIFPQPAFGTQDIKLVELVDSMYGKCLMGTLSERASYELYKLSFDSLDNRLVLVVINQVIGFSIIDHVIENGTIIVFVEMNQRMLEELLGELNLTISRVNKLKKAR